MVRGKILSRSRVNPKRVTLLDGKTFYAIYEGASRRNLPANVTVKRARGITPRRQLKRKQRRLELLSSAFILGLQLFKPSYITKGIGIDSKVLNSSLGKKNN